MAQAAALANGKHPAQEAGQGSGEQREFDEKVEAADATAAASASADDKAQAAEELDALKLADAEAAGSVRSADVKDVSSAAHLRASEVPELAEDVDVEAGEGQGAQLSTASEAAGTSCQAGAIREAAVVTSSEESAPARHRPAAASADELPESPESADMEAGTA